MDEDEIKYCLAKQLSSMYAIETNYGAISLDAEMTEAIESVLRPMLEARLRKQDQTEE